eukprot:403366330
MQSDLIVYANSAKPNTQYVSTQSDEYKKFIKRIEQNFAIQNFKLSACTYCWGFMTAQQKKRHPEHGPYHITPSYFKDETSFLALCKLHGKLMEIGKGPNKQIKVPLFNEQSLNVDQAVFGQPNEQQPFPKLPYEQFKPRFVHQCLATKGGPLTTEIDNPHTAENSGIPTAKMRNQSLNEMLKRMQNWHKDQALINQKTHLELQRLKQDNEELRSKVYNQEYQFQQLLNFLKKSMLTGQPAQDLFKEMMSNFQNENVYERNVFDNQQYSQQQFMLQSSQQQQFLGIAQQNEGQVLALPSEGQLDQNQNLNLMDDRLNASHIEELANKYQIENSWIALNDEDSPISDL